MDTMELYKKTAETQGILTHDQRSILEQWAINNEIHTLDIERKGNILVAKGVGHFEGVSFGVIGISFIVMEKLKNEYRLEVDRGFKKFLEEKSNAKRS